jgi:hypothetical protein
LSLRQAMQHGPDCGARGSWPTLISVRLQRGRASPTSETITSTGPTSIVQPSIWSAAWLLSGTTSCFGPRLRSNRCRRWSNTALEALHHIFGSTSFTQVSTSASADVFDRGSSIPLSLTELQADTVGHEVNGTVMASNTRLRGP